MRDTRPKMHGLSSGIAIRYLLEADGGSGHEHSNAERVELYNDLVASGTMVVPPKESKIVKLWNTEPALLMGVIQAAIVLAVSFGLSLTTEQTAAILSLSAVLLAIITRQRVTPV